MSNFFFLAKTAIRKHLWKLVYTKDDNVILVSDSVVMIGTLHDFLKGSSCQTTTFDDLIVTSALDHKRNSLILALDDSTLWSLIDGTRRLIGCFESPHLICIDQSSRAMVVASMHGLITWWKLDQESINDSLKVHLYDLLK